MTLAAPFASIVVGNEFGTDWRIVHDHSAFTSLGRELKAEDLSDAINTFFLKTCHIEVCLQLFRHLVIAIQRRFMPEAFGPVSQAQQVVDQQAGHSSKVADEHYAIEWPEIRLALSTTIRKFAAASSRYWYIAWGDIPGMLLPEERKASNKAPRVIQEAVIQEGGYIAHPAPQKEQAAKLAGLIARELQSSFDKIFAQLVAMFSTGPASFQLTHSAVATEPHDPHIAGQGSDVSMTSSPCGRESPMEQQPASVSSPLLGSPISIQKPAATVPVSDNVNQLDDAATTYNVSPPALVVQPRHLGLLRVHRQPTAQFTSPEQAQSLVHVMRRRSSLLSVLPTGGVTLMHPV
ncbi:hypothetical protein RhiLY_12081 [Ceratobasidium sp. AG-Ba]|nr:hypothetical protein RhiLY_12081 [Ceratobasidium sp. AG-Ba]